MKKFFENYGFVALTAIVIIVLIIMASPVGNAIENSTVSIVGSFAAQVNNSVTDNVKTSNVSPNEIILIDGKKYVILQTKGIEKYLIMDLNGFNKEFNVNGNGQNPDTCRHFADGTSIRTGCVNLYEGSNIDSYLNEVYYNTLPFKDAIIPENITQQFYSKKWNNPNYRETSTNFEWFINGKWVKYDFFIPTKGDMPGYLLQNRGTINQKGQKTKTITRNIFLPSYDELNTIVNFNDAYECTHLLNHGDVRLRDGFYNNTNSSISIFSASYGPDWSFIGYKLNCKPTFVIDLSKVDYSKTNELFIK